ncbi:MAG: flagellar basal body-associated protein FliL [Sulfurimonas sp.]
MAEEESTEEEAPQEKKSSNMLMIIIIVVLVLIIAIGGVVAVLMMGSDEEDVTASAPQVREKSASSSQRSSSARSDSMSSRKLQDIGVLYPLDTFTVNLKSDSGRRYLKVTLSLELEGEELSLELDAKSAVLRDRIIRILTSKTLEEISSKKGKAKVESQIMDTLNAMISDGQIKGIYFTEFVIQ